MPTLWSCVRQDLRTSSWSQRILPLTTVGWIAYEWGCGNETLTPWILVRVISTTSHRGRRLLDVRRDVQGRLALAHATFGRRTSRVGTAVDRAEGTRRVHVGDDSCRSDRVGGHGYGRIVSEALRGQRAAPLCGLVVAGIGSIVAAAVWVGRTVPVLQPSTGWLLRVLGNPLFWIALLALVPTINAIRRRSSTDRPAARTRS